MKAIHLFLIWICVLLNTPSFAQLQKIPLELKIEKAITIVEGEVVLSQSFEERGKIYTAHLIEVHKILKTNGEEEPFVTVTTLGGSYGNKKVEWSHLLELSEGDKGIFCLKPSNRPRINDARFLGNNFDVYSSGQGFFRYTEGEKEILVKDFLEEYSSKEWLIEKIAELTEEEQKIIVDKEEKCIVISIEPSEVVQPLGSIGFDVKIRSLEEEFKLYQSLVAVKYDTDFFGNSIVLNEILTWEESGVSLSNAYFLDAIDIAEDILQIKLDFSGSPDELFTISTDKVKIGSFVVDLSSFNGQPSFNFDYELMEQENQYFDEDTGRGKPFRCIKIENDLFKPPCPDIEDFMPKTAAAGVGEVSENGIPGVITITGSNFGAPPAGSIIQKPDNYRVGFRNAGEGNFYVYPPERDYISWTETEIQVKVPSVGETGNAIEYAGTGNILVVKTDEANCEDISDDELFVPFCTRNGVLLFTTSNTRKSIPVKLANVNTEGGYDVLLEDDFLNLADNSREAFLRALETWQCEVNVNFVEKSIDDVIDFNTLCTVSVNEDMPTGVNVTTAATTPIDPLDCSSTDHFYLPKWDIIFNKFYTNDEGEAVEIVWYTEEGEIPPAQDMLPNVSLEGVALHEIGHALLLRHVRNEDKVMRQGVNRITLTPDDFNGGEHIVKLSISQPHCQIAMNEYDCLLDNVTDIKSGQILNYPNPVENILTIELKETFKGTIEVHNSLGQLVHQNEIENYLDYLTIDLSDLASGTHYISLITENNILSTIKIVKL